METYKSGAGNGTRTRDPNLGKVVLYQLSYSRIIFRSIRYAHKLIAFLGHKSGSHYIKFPLHVSEHSMSIYPSRPLILADLSDSFSFN
ncbi:uncharacterized protein METZ01_LOCUS195551 [marine metagenome]|uniref:Uncharacterized protein n=1 Tax=marine metagenome TaxID=408172 RepID=A0A382DYN2_9ZZZZ